MASFEIGGAVIPMEAGDGNITQSYSPKHEGTVLGLGDGSSFKQTLEGAVGKLKSVLSGKDAWSQASLSGLNYSQSMVLKCGAPRNIYDADTDITITSKRRSDEGYTPRGYGIVNGSMVETDVSLMSNTAQLSPVPGATSYMLTYWPQIVVFALFRENMDGSSAKFGWTLTCEEV